LLCRLNIIKTDLLQGSTWTHSRLIGFRRIICWLVRQQTSFIAADLNVKPSRAQIWLLIALLALVMQKNPLHADGQSAPRIALCRVMGVTLLLALWCDRSGRQSSFFVILMSEGLEPTGFEPVTSSMPLRRSTN